MTTKRNGVFVVVAVILALLSSASAASAQSTKRYEFGRDSRTKQILFIKNKKAYTPRYERGLTLKSGAQTLAAAPYQSLTDSTIKTDPVLAADKFLRSNASKFGVSAGSLYPQKVEIDNIGMAHVRYQQRYRDIPVFGGGLIVHVGANNIVTAANGRVARRISADVPSERLRLSEDEAREIARNFWFAEYGREVTPVVEVRGTYIYSPTFLGTVNYSLNATPSPTASPRPSASPYGSSTPAPTSTPRVSSRLSYGDYVYRIVAHSDETHNTQIYFVDARTGELRGRESGVRGINRVVSDCSSGTCKTNRVDGRYGSYVFGRSEGQPIRGACPVPTYQGMTDTDELYDVLGSIHQYFATTFGANGTNGNGGSCYGDGNAAAGIPWINATAAYAFRPEGCPNSVAGMNSSNGSLAFCPGTIVPSSVAHEYSHTLVLFSHRDSGGIPVGMTYLGESGALDESQADVFGELIEEALVGESDWIARVPTIGVVRNLQAPDQPAFSVPSGHPDRFYSSKFHCGTEDNGGVHFNSTVPSYAFYLMTRGGQFNGCDISGIGSLKVSRILHRAVTLYYAQTESFNGAYNGIIQACSDLLDVDECRQVTAALQAVEMDQGGGCSQIAAAAPQCASATCTDSDGDNATIAGTVALQGITYADRCQSDVSLSEAVCTNGAVSFKQYHCANGCIRPDGARCG